MNDLPLQALRDQVEYLLEQVAERDRLIARQQQTIRDLEQRLAAAERSARRQAAPFSQGPPSPNPKRPGRKRGRRHGKHGHRPPPEPPQVDETLEAPLPEHCPDCGGDLTPTHVDQQFQTEIPRQPVVRQFNVHCGRCQGCGKRCRGRHPLQTSDAVGAAASQLGPDAQAAVVYLHKHAGLSHGKIADVYGRLFGIRLTRGACAQIVLRGGRRLRPAYEAIRDRLGTATHLTPDETGWRVGGRPVWLHAWVGDDGSTCFAIDPQRGAGVLAAVIGWGWSGTLTHDGWASYDGFADAIHQQCVAHALRRARALADRQAGAAKIFPRQVIDLFQGALQARDQYLEGALDEAGLEAAHTRYVDQLLDLSGRPRVNAANRTFADHLYNHGEQWLTFLCDPGIAATNHRAEQALQVPIVNRKVWGGNRTAAGAEAQAVTSSVLQTCKNKAVDAFAYVSDAFRGILGNLYPASEK
jgi:transposase